MKRKSQIFLRVIALILAVIYPCSEFAWAASDLGKRIDPARPQILKISIPESLGNIEESFTGTSGKTVVYIQDAHDSVEAQIHIAKMIRQLVVHSGIKTVFEEGYEGEVPTDAYFGGIKDTAARKKVSRHFLNRLQIGGAEYAHINRKKNFRLFGADNIRLHLENVQSYRQASENQASARKDFERLENVLIPVLQKKIPREFKVWMKIRQRFDQNQLDLPNYLKRLNEIAKPETGAFPAVETVLNAVKPGEKQAVGKIRALNAKALFEETKALEELLANRQLKTQTQRKLFRNWRTIQTLKRLNALEISEEELSLLRKDLDLFKTERFARFISRISGRSLILSKRWEQNIQDALRFYEIAQKRDKVIEETFAKSEAKNSALVFGGFHRSAILESLRRNQISYHVIMPKITAVNEEQRNLYKKLMSAGVPTAPLGIVAKASRVVLLFTRGEYLGQRFEIRDQIKALTMKYLQTASVRAEIRAAWQSDETWQPFTRKHHEFFKVLSDQGYSLQIWHRDDGEIQLAAGDRDRTVARSVPREEWEKIARVLGKLETHAASEDAMKNWPESGSAVGKSKKIISGLIKIVADLNRADASREVWVGGMRDEHYADPQGRFTLRVIKEWIPGVEGFTKSEIEIDRQGHEPFSLTLTRLIQESSLDAAGKIGRYFSKNYERLQSLDALKLNAVLKEEFEMIYPLRSDFGKSSLYDAVAYMLGKYFPEGLKGKKGLAMDDSNFSEDEFGLSPSHAAGVEFYRKLETWGVDMTAAHPSTRMPPKSAEPTPWWKLEDMHTPDELRRYRKGKIEFGDFYTSAPGEPLLDFIYDPQGVSHRSALEVNFREDRLRVYEGMAKALKPGGILVAAHYWDPMHDRPFFPDEWLLSAGLEVLEQRYSGPTLRVYVLKKIDRSEIEASQIRWGKEMYERLRRKIEIYSRNETDWSLMRFALGHLSANAYDAVVLRAAAKEPGYKGKMHVKVSMTPDGVLHTVLEDNGVGMDKATLEQVMEKWDFSTKRGIPLETLPPNYRIYGHMGQATYEAGDLLGRKKSALVTINTLNSDGEAYRKIFNPRSRKSEIIKTAAEELPPGIRTRIQIDYQLSTPIPPSLEYEQIFFDGEWPLPPPVHTSGGGGGGLDSALLAPDRSEIRSRELEILNVMDAARMNEVMRGVMNDGSFQRKSLHEKWQTLANQEKQRVGGVLVLRRIDGEWHFLLGQRQNTEIEPGAFNPPGGKVSKQRDEFFENADSIEELSSRGLLSAEDFNLRSNVESTAGAAVRELYEEAGIKIHTSDLSGRLDDYFGTPETTLIQHFVWADSSENREVPGSVSKDGDGMQTFAWVPVNLLLNTSEEEAGPAVDRFLGEKFSGNRLIDGADPYGGVKSLRRLLRVVANRGFDLKEQQLIHVSVHSAVSPELASDVRDMEKALAAKGLLHDGKIEVLGQSRSEVQPQVRAGLENFRDQKILRFVMEGAYLDDCCRQAWGPLFERSRQNEDSQLEIHFPVDLIDYPHDFLGQSSAAEKIKTLRRLLEMDAKGFPFEIYVDGNKVGLEWKEASEVAEGPARARLYLWSSAEKMTSEINLVRPEVRSKSSRHREIYADPLERFLRKEIPRLFIPPSGEREVAWLDFGSGTGAFIPKFNARLETLGFSKDKITGYGIEAGELYALAAQRFSHLPILYGDAGNYEALRAEYPKELPANLFFDLVIMNAPDIHAIDFKAFLKTAYRFLKPNGRVLVRLFTYEEAEPGQKRRTKNQIKKRRDQDGERKRVIKMLEENPYFKMTPLTVDETESLDIPMGNHEVGALFVLQKKKDLSAADLAFVEDSGDKPANLKFEKQVRSEVRTGVLDDMVIMRYTHDSSKFGGVSTHLGMLDNELLKNNKADIYIFYPQPDPSASEEIVVQKEPVWKGRKIYVPLKYRGPPAKQVSSGSKRVSFLRRIKQMLLKFIFVFIFPFMIRHFKVSTLHNLRDWLYHPKRLRPSKYFPFVGTANLPILGQRAKDALVIREVFSKKLDEILPEIGNRRIFFMDHDALTANGLSIAEEVAKRNLPRGFEVHLAGHTGHTYLMRALKEMIPHASGVTLRGLESELGADAVDLKNGVDTEKFNPGAPDLQAGRFRNAHKIAPDTFFILMPARIAPFKGHADMIQAAVRLKTLLKENPERHFMIGFAGAPYTTIADTSALVQHFQKLIERQNLQTNARFLGNLTQDELREAYLDSDAVVLPSYGEGLPRVVLEAEAMEVPVISTNVDGALDVIHDEESGYLITPGDSKTLADKLYQLMQMPPEQRRAMGRAGRKIVEGDYTKELLGQRHEQFYIQRADLLPAKLFTKRAEIRSQEAPFSQATIRSLIEELDLLGFRVTYEPALLTHPERVHSFGQLLTALRNVAKRLPAEKRKNIATEWRRIFYKEHFERDIAIRYQTAEGSLENQSRDLLEISFDVKQLEALVNNADSVAKLEAYIEERLSRAEQGKYDSEGDVRLEKSFRPHQESLSWHFDGAFWDHLTPYMKAMGADYRESIGGSPDTNRKLIAYSAGHYLEQLEKVYQREHGRPGGMQPRYYVEVGAASVDHAKIFIEELNKIAEDRGQTYLLGYTKYVLADFSKSIIEDARKKLGDSAASYLGVSFEYLVVDAEDPYASLGEKYKGRILRYHATNVVSVMATDEIARKKGKYYHVYTRLSLPAPAVQALAETYQDFGITLDQLKQDLESIEEKGVTVFLDRYQELFRARAKIRENYQVHEGLERGDFEFYHFWQELWNGLKFEDEYVPIKSLAEFDFLNDPKDPAAPKFPKPGPALEAMFNQYVNEKGDPLDFRIHLSNHAVRGILQIMDLLDVDGAVETIDIVIKEMSDYQRFRGPMKYDGSQVNYFNWPILKAMLDKYYPASSHQLVSLANFGDKRAQRRILEISPNREPHLIYDPETYRQVEEVYKKQTGVALGDAIFRGLEDFGLEQGEKWVIRPGMGWGEAETHWTDGKKRPAAYSGGRRHEANDLGLKRRVNGRDENIRAGILVPFLLGGKVYRKWKDDMRETVITLTPVKIQHEGKTKRLVVVDTHIQANENLKAGDEVLQGDRAGTMEDHPQSSNSPVAIHRHLGIALLDEDLIDDNAASLESPHEEAIFYATLHAWAAEGKIQYFQWFNFLNPEQRKAKFIENGDAAAGLKQIIVQVHHRGTRLEIARQIGRQTPGIRKLLVEKPEMTERILAKQKNGIHLVVTGTLEDWQLTKREPARKSSELIRQGSGPAALVEAIIAAETLYRSRNSEKIDLGISITAESLPPVRMEAVSKESILEAVRNPKSGLARKIVETFPDLFENEKQLRSTEVLKRFQAAADYGLRVIPRGRDYEIQLVEDDSYEIGIEGQEKRLIPDDKVLFREKIPKDHPWRVLAETLIAGLNSSQRRAMEEGPGYSRRLAEVYAAARSEIRSNVQKPVLLLSADHARTLLDQAPILTPREESALLIKMGRRDATYRGMREPKVVDDILAEKAIVPKGAKELHWGNIFKAFDFAFDDGSNYWDGVSVVAEYVPDPKHGYHLVASGLRGIGNNSTAQKVLLKHVSRVWLTSLVEGGYKIVEVVFPGMPSAESGEEETPKDRSEIREAVRELEIRFRQYESQASVRRQKDAALDEAVTLKHDVVFVMKAATLESLSHAAGQNAYDRWLELLGLKMLNEDHLHLVILTNPEEKMGKRTEALFLKHKNVHLDWKGVPLHAPVFYFEDFQDGVLTAPRKISGQDNYTINASFDSFDGMFLSAVRLSKDAARLNEQSAAFGRVITEALAADLGFLNQFFQSYAIVSRAA